ncbi:MAG: CCA tRNA nucleotidyltransferase [Aeriscardovia sp.]|nr:CCA tRNA nucleotidyltransferase [Aeriscardovia sp.]
MQLGEMFADAGFELSLVGGAVRDLLLSRPVHDYDFATSATVEQSEPILRAWGKDGFWDMGRPFGTLGAKKRSDNGSFVSAEVTTYRSDTYSPNSRKPRIDSVPSLESDLSRRDFTINCMAIRLPEVTFVDPFGGALDLGRKILRTPIDPFISFGDDPLRIMRGVRFMAQLGFYIESSTSLAISSMAPRLSIVSAERIRDEFVKILLSKHPRRGINAMVDLGIADVVLPEIPALKMEIDEHHMHKDVYGHTLSVLTNAINLETGPEGDVPGPDLVLRLSSLLHDIGKPPTRRFESEGKVSFHHHDAVGAKMARKRLQALCFDKKTVDDVSSLVGLHLRFHGYVDEPWSDSAVRRYVVDAGHLYTRLNRLTRADVTTKNRRKILQFEEAMDKLESRAVELKKQEDLSAIRPELNGNEIMALLGLRPGKEVGLAYQHMLDYRMQNGLVGYLKAKKELLNWAEENLNL